jgi:hypothetical protein
VHAAEAGLATEGLGGPTGAQLVDDGAEGVEVVAGGSVAGGAAGVGLGPEGAASFECGELVGGREVELAVDELDPRAGAGVVDPDDVAGG